MTKLTEIDHVAIAVKDLEAAIDYYQRASHVRSIWAEGGSAARPLLQHLVQVGPGNL